MRVPVTLSYEHFRAALRGERLPCVVIDLDAFDRNLERHVAVLPAAVPLRVATKSLRVPALLRRLLDRGNGRLRGLMCFSVEEARELADAGFDDLFVAYPVIAARDLGMLVALRTSGVHVSVALDSYEAAEALSRAGHASRVEMLAVLCVDMSLRALGSRVHLGVRRSPLHEPADVVALAEKVRELPAIRVHGVMGYEAQVAGLGDQSPFDGRALQLAKGLVRRASMRDIAQRRCALVAELERRGFELAFVNGGGTGSLDVTAPSNGVTELTAGSGFYKPLLFDGYTSAFVRSLEPAAFFVLEVTRKPAPALATCLGGGYVASGSAGPDKLPRPHLPHGLSLLPGEGVGEVQTPLAGASRVALGDPVVFRHAKAGELMERFNEVLLVRAGTVVGRELTYRGRGWCFF